MKVIRLSIIVPILFTCFSVTAQDKKERPKEKKSLLDKVSELPETLIAQKERVDTNASRFIQDILSIEVPPVWKEKGSMLFNDLKLTKTDKEPLNATLPLPNKKLTHGMNLTLNTIKKSPADKKAMVFEQIKIHLLAYYKQAGLSKSPDEIKEQIETMVTGPEVFITRQGKTGDLYVIHDIQTQQSSLIILFLVPGTQPNVVHFVQFQYYRFIYETSPPEDVMEWKTFVYPDEQQVYVDFTKELLKTLFIR